jgi:GH18 family chitinase
MQSNRYSTNTNTLLRVPKHQNHDSKNSAAHQHVCRLSFYNLLINTYAQQRNKPVIIGYVGGYNGNIIATEQIEAKRLSHINYAFVDIKANRAWLHNEKTDTVNFRKLVELKKLILI